MVYFSRGTSIMTVAAIYDIHGNLPALEAVIREIRQSGVDRIVVSGDVVPGPMPRETIARLLELDIPMQFIHGNGDRVVLGQMRGPSPGADASSSPLGRGRGEGSGKGDLDSAESNEVPEQFREVIRWNAEQLHPEHEQLIASWPKTVQIEIPGLGEVLFCHATPRDDNEIFTRLTPEDHLAPVFDKLDAALIVCGHTHMQFDRTIGRVRVVNAGSVGMPFGKPGAYWLLLGHGVQFRHTAYDLAKAADQIRQTRYPQAQDFAARNILQPPSEREMLEA
jgi:predicted phosphodiesterase